MKELNVGIIGYGLRASGVFDLMYNLYPEVKINLTAVCDPKPVDELKEKLESANVDVSKTLFFTDVDEMLDSGNFDGIIIGTRCTLHTKFAVKVLEKKIPLFLEKPVCTTYEDWEILKSAYDKYGGEVVVSFPLRITPMVTEIKNLIEQLELGPIQHIAAFNYVTYGGDYYHEWYRDESETGGLFMQKATHDFDYINHILGESPVEICAMKSKQVMKGDMPAGLKCEDCDKKYTCKEGPYQIVNTTGDFVHGPYCCYAKDTGNEDSGTAIMRYADGKHAVYTQNFFVRNKHAGKRGAIFSGEGGTLEFDWHTSDIIVRKNYIPGEMKYHVETAGRHGGGDLKLVENFVAVMQGIETSKTPLEQGLLSAYMCLKARESAETGKFVSLNYFGR